MMPNISIGALRCEAKGCDMQNFLIRECTRADIDAIVHMERRWEQEDIAYGDFDPISREAWIDNLERFPEYFLVAECAGQVVGYINATVQRDQRLEAIAEQQTYVAIENIYILPKWRNQDIGGQLIETLFEVAKRQGIERFTVSSSSKQMDKILKFYRSHGFTLWQIHLFK
jgi:ribosomal protein S18 acetylase RimI-like enzyme